jgi:hypothetical protein
LRKQKSGFAKRVTSLASLEMLVSHPLKFLRESETLKANIGNIPKVSKIEQRCEDYNLESLTLS